MSLGYRGRCKLIDQDDTMAIYTYAGENWNDNGKSQENDCDLQDGLIIIYKKCLVEPEIHEKIKKMPSGKKKLIVKRIRKENNIAELIGKGDIVIDKRCKNEFSRSRYNENQHYLAERLIDHIFDRYQDDGMLPIEEYFIQ